MPFTIVGNGNQKRDFICKDLVDAFFKTAESKNVGEVYNLDQENQLVLIKLLNNWR